MLRLPREVSPLFRDWLAEHYPDRAARVMGRVREMHGGKRLRPRMGQADARRRALCQIIARQRFDRAARRLGLDAPLPALRSDLFAVPPEPGDQLAFAL